MNKITIIAYHYVRDLQHSRYPSIKGLDVRLFEEQVAYLQKNYHPIRMEELIHSIETGDELPPKAALLTFDDAYTDHFNYVLPILYNRGLQGSFYVPCKAIAEHIVLDVNKIHFILAAATDIEVLLEKIFKDIDHYRDEYQLESNDYYIKKWMTKHPKDTPQVILFKRLLQKALPAELRRILADKFFEEVVGISQEIFSRELYMSPEQIRCMQSAGMHIGNHTYDHYWLNTLPVEQQKTDITKAQNFLKKIGVNMDNWTMCYPHGGHNQDTMNILADMDCKLAITIDVKIADTTTFHKYELPRLDTNDVPKVADAPVNQWFAEA